MSTIPWTKWEAVLRRLQVPHDLPWKHFISEVCVYLRVSPFRKVFYVGSTSVGVLQRESTRARKHLQFTRQRLAYSEPAIRWRAGTHSLWEFICVPVQPCTQTAGPVLVSSCFVVCRFCLALFLVFALLVSSAVLALPCLCTKEPPLRILRPLRTAPCHGFVLLLQPCFSFLFLFFFPVLPAARGAGRQT